MHRVLSDFGSTHPNSGVGMHPAVNYAPALLEEELGAGSIGGPSCSWSLRIPAIGTPVGPLQSLGFFFFNTAEPTQARSPCFSIHF